MEDWEKKKKKELGEGGGEPGGVSRGAARGGRRGCGERARRWQLSGPLQTAARAAAPESCELAEPRCISSRSCEHCAGSQQGDVPGSILFRTRAAAAGGFLPSAPTCPPPGLRVCMCVCARAPRFGGQSLREGARCLCLSPPLSASVVAHACFPGAPRSSYPLFDTAAPLTPAPLGCLSFPRCSRCQPCCVCVQPLGAVSLSQLPRRWLRPGGGRTAVIFWMINNGSPPSLSMTRKSDSGTNSET